MNLLDDIESIKKTFELILNEVNINKPAYIDIKPKADSVLAVRNNQQNVTIEVNPNLGKQIETKEELDILLRHEVCHIFTLDNFDLVSYGDPSSMSSQPYMDLQDLFREYIAERDFKIRFPQYHDKYLAIKKRNFSEKEQIDAYSPVLNDTNLYRNDFIHIITDMYFRIGYNAVYIFMDDNKWVEQWTKENQVIYSKEPTLNILSLLPKLLKLIFEDFEYITSHYSQIEKIRRLILECYIYISLIGIFESCEQNKLILLRDLDIFKEHTEFDRGLFKIWENRELDVQVNERLSKNEQNHFESNSLSTEKKIGRNDPCPCGSGKKFKHCHGKK